MKQTAGTTRSLFWLSCLFLLPGLLSAQTFPRSSAQTRPALAAELESSGNRYLLTLENNSERGFQGQVRVSLGPESAQVEAGRVVISLPANGTKLLLIATAGISGTHYTLQIFDQRNILVFYKVAPMRPISGTAPSNVESISLSTNSASMPAAVPASAPTPVSTAPTPPVPEIQIKVRVLAGVQESDPFILAFDLTAAKALLNAKLEITIGKVKLAKAINLNKQAVVEFNLPESLETNQISYKLSRQDGSLVTEGTSNLDKLYADDHVTVADIRPDRVAYSPGETARLIIVLEGQSPHGFKLDLLARDFTGNTFFTNTAYGNSGEIGKEKEFTFTMPSDVKGPVIIEFKVYDAETGLLFDSGERELTIKETKD